MKKILCLALVTCLGITMAIPSYAGEEDGKGLEQAILAVKKVVAIPEDYKEFSYHTYEQETDWGTGTVWSLNWSSGDDKSSIYASVDWLGNLLYLEHYQRSEESGLAKVKREQASETVKIFLQKAVPGLASNFMEVDVENSLQDNYRHVFRYSYHNANILVPFINITIRVNKYTGTVESYSGVEAGFELPTFPATEGSIGSDKAQSSFLKNIGIKLTYQSYYSYKDKQLSVFPVYRVANSNKAVDAHTGEIVDLFYSRVRYGNAEEKAMDVGGMGDSALQNLTKEELDAIEKSGKLLSKDEAAARVIGQIPVNLSQKDILSASLRRNNIDVEKYIWQIYFEKAYGSVDASTGELLSYSYYSDRTEGKRDLTEESAKSIAESFLKKVANEKLAMSVFTPDYIDYIIYEREGEKPEAYSFRYNRLVNGIEFEDNGLSVTVDRKTGDITFYNNIWYDSAIFPSVEDVMTESEMMTGIMRGFPFAMAYEKTGKNGDVDLVYTFDQEARTAMFEPFSGMRISFDGKLFESAKRPEYEDIKGHWSEKIVRELMENGYYLKSDSFKPDRTITQIDFFRYLFVPETRYYDDEELYEMLENRGILKDGEGTPESELTRKDAAKFLVRYLGLGLAGEHPEIYVSKFKDQVEIEYRGYATLCYGLGIMRGDDKGRFNGEKAMTNAEAASAIYNMMKIK
ncbi:MAG: S-layer homology domain-containing protein [Clostridiales bacterium]|nr:S-layer homology domain-containing protein [Clostridiales bacterium]